MRLLPIVNGLWPVSVS